MSDSYEKGASERLDYTVDWSDFLGSATIGTSTWSVPSGLTGTGPINTTTTATINLGGGVIGNTYRVRNRITTSDSPNLYAEKYVNISVVKR